MMAERLQGYRMDVNNPNTKGFAPGVVRELLDHIAQLEAQRGELARELDLTKREAWTAKERHKDEKDRADGLRERLDELSAEDFAKAQRGGAVVVAAAIHLKGLTDDDCEHIQNKFGIRSKYDVFNVWGEAQSRIRPIPADRVLGDGMVGVDENYLSDLEETVIDVVESLDRGFVVCQNCGSQEDTSTLDVMGMDLMPMKARIDALRSAKGEVE